MSSINFESKNKSVSVRGSERFHALNLCNKIMNIFLDADWNREILRSAMPANHGLPLGGDYPGWGRDFNAAFNYESFKLQLGDKEFGSFLLGLNTATAVGDDSLKMLARIHGQCELHGYVAGKNRNWMAKIIEDGPVDIFRSESGWEELVDFLRESDKEPVVMSYSATGSFISSAMYTFISDYLATEGIVENSEDYDADAHEEKREIAEQKWDELDDDTRWDLAVEYLLRTPEKGLEMTPEAWPIALGYDEMTAGKLIEELKKNSTM